MTSTPCAALDRIAAFLAIIVETILTILHELGVCCREVSLLRRKAGFLAPAASALYILARKRWPEFEGVRGSAKLEAKDIERVPKGFERVSKGY
ncbi:hypothetical protein [Taklimakanibacter deserti]|uniref:hypothetical protein n=1 Tax=Taklimakanibacter deserti TaxID=2267839 RepID=UPI000E65C91B